MEYVYCIIDMWLFVVKFITLKMGALSSDSAIIDSDLQTSKEDYYKLLKTINSEVQKVIKILDY